MLTEDWALNSDIAKDSKTLSGSFQRVRCTVSGDIVNVTRGKNF